jgi:hypothetical protein
LQAVGNDCLLHFYDRLRASASPGKGPTQSEGMKTKRIIAVTVLAILLLLALAVFRGQTPRELILKKNGLPMANLRADLLSNCGGATVVHTSTDQDGRLDLGALPAETKQINIELWDGEDSPRNSLITLPPRGSLTIDRRGKRTICTTKITYADFGFFKLTSQEVQDWQEITAASKAKPK